LCCCAELNSSDGEGFRGYSTAPWELPSVFWDDRGRGSPVFRLQEQAQAALSKQQLGIDFESSYPFAIF